MTIFATAIGRYFGHVGISLGLTWIETGLLDVKSIAYGMIVIGDWVVEVNWEHELKLKQLLRKC